jgi:hypothetical protein
MRAAHPAPDFVLICATGAPFSPILLILPIEESITYLFSMAFEVVPFHETIYEMRTGAFSGIV